MPRLRKSVPFCGLPFVNVPDVPRTARAAVLGAGSSRGTPNDGAENGPYFVRTVSKAYTWGASQPALIDLRGGATALADVVDLGDLEFGDVDIEQALAQIATVVDLLPDPVIPAVLGGDHTITLPVVTALQRRHDRPFTVVQFDHHLDLQIWEGAPGDPTAAREPVFHTNVMSHVADRLGPGRLLQVGVGPYAVVEASCADAMPEYLASIGHQVPVFAPELDDPAALCALITTDDVYLSVDVDVLDRTEMSATGYPADFGLCLRRVLRLIDSILAQRRLIGFDVNEFAAARDARDPATLADAARVAQLFLHLLGWARRQSPVDHGRMAARR